MSSESINNLIKLDAIDKDYYLGQTKVSVLKKVHLEIDKGEYIAIVGPSGSGKSTLMNLLGFLDVPTSGEYFFKGKSTQDFSSDELAMIRSRQIGFVFQSFHLLSHKTVFDNVMLPLLYRDDISWSDRPRYVREALEAARLEKKLWHHKTNQISGGQRQRVAIARALVGKPSLILADEPTGNLDSRTGQEVLETMASLNKDLGTTVAIITHDHYVAEHAHRVIQIIDGVVSSDNKKIN